MQTLGSELHQVGIIQAYLLHGVLYGGAGEQEAVPAAEAQQYFPPHTGSGRGGNWMIMILFNAHPHSGLPGATLDGLGLVKDHVLPLHTLEVLHILHHLHTHTHTINTHFAMCMLVG